MSELAFKSLFNRYGKDAFLYKLTDTKEVTGFNKKPVKTKKQPCDFLVTLRGETFFAEVKESANTTSFPFANIRECQMSYAMMIVAAKGTYLFYILNSNTLT